MVSAGASAGHSVHSTRRPYNTSARPHIVSWRPPKKSVWSTSSVTSAHTPVPRLGAGVWAPARPQRAKSHHKDDTGGRVVLARESFARRVLTTQHHRPVYHESRQQLAAYEEEELPRKPPPARPRVIQVQAAGLGSSLQPSSTAQASGARAAQGYSQSAKDLAAVRGAPGRGAPRRPVQLTHS